MRLGKFLRLTIAILLFGFYAKAKESKNVTRIIIEESIDLMELRVEQVHWDTCYYLDIWEINCHAEKLLYIIDHYLETEIEQSTEDYHQEAYALYQKILQPIEKRLTRNVEISAEGLYKQIPWEALLKNEVKRDTKPEYLIYSHRFRLHQNVDKDKKVNWVPEHKIISLKPEYQGKEKIHWPQINRLFIRKRQEQTKFQKKIYSAQILHIESHTLDSSRKHKNLQSLSPKYLGVNWVQSAEFQTPLVFANSCSTARIPEGAENSIAEIFLEKGAYHCVGTLWDINDELAVRMAEGFYKEYVKHRSISRALSSAKIKIIQAENGKYAHPYNWAGYQHYTSQDHFETATYKFEDRYHSLLMTLLSFISLLGVLFKSTWSKISRNYNFL